MNYCFVFFPTNWTESNCKKSLMGMEENDKYFRVKKYNTPEYRKLGYNTLKVFQEGCCSVDVEDAINSSLLLLTEGIIPHVTSRMDPSVVATATP